MNELIPTSNMNCIVLLDVNKNEMAIVEQILVRYIFAILFQIGHAEVMIKRFSLHAGVGIFETATVH